MKQESSNILETRASLPKQCKTVRSLCKNSPIFPFMYFIHLHSYSFPEFLDLSILLLAVHRFLLLKNGELMITSVFHSLHHSPMDK